MTTRIPKAILPKCDFCNEKAVYDTQTILGPWANVCEQHFNIYSTKIEGLFSIYEHTPEPTKFCSLCGKEKPIGEYYKYIDKNGVERFRTECKDCNLHERKMRSFRK